MKKLLAVALCGLCLFTSGCATTHKASEYPNFGRITAISGETVTVVDGAGEVWKFTGAEDYALGDGVSMIMSDHGTPNDIRDDEIISTRYSRM